MVLGPELREQCDPGYSEKEAEWRDSFVDSSPAHRRSPSSLSLGLREDSERHMILLYLYCKRLWQYTPGPNTTEAQKAAATELCTPVTIPDELCAFGGFLFLESHRGLCSSGWKGTCQPRVLRQAHKDRPYRVHACHSKNVVCGHSWQPVWEKHPLPSAHSSPLEVQRRLCQLAAVDAFPQCSS